MTRNLLIVEDNKVHMDALCKIIEDMEADIRILCAEHAGEAFLLASRYHIHIFLIDIVLNAKDSGDVSGLYFAEEIRKNLKYKFTPLIFITSLEDPKLFSYSQLHCFGYIEKPLSVSLVRDTIFSALDFPYKEDDDRYICFRKEGIVYSKHLKEIVYIENSRKRMKIYCINDKLEIPYKTCKNVLRELNSDAFIQCSRYGIVNRRYIEQIDYTNRFIKLKHIDFPVEIGTIMKRSFRSRIENE